MVQAKGSSAKLIFDYGDTDYGNVIAEGSRRPKVLAFNTFNVSKNRSLNQAQTIRGNRNPIVPFYGNADVSGQIVVPVSEIDFGYWLSLLFGKPTTSQNAESADRKVGVPTIAVTAGVATLSVAQVEGTNIDIGDKLISASATVYVQSITSTTVYVIRDINGDIPADFVAETLTSITTESFNHVFKIHPTNAIAHGVTELSLVDISPLLQYYLFSGLKANRMAIGFTGEAEELLATFDVVGKDMLESENVSAGGNVTITAGTAEFTIAQPNVAVGDMLIYGTANDIAYITVKTDSDTMTVKTTRAGSTNPANTAGAVAVGAIIQNGNYAGHGSDEIFTPRFIRFENKHATLTEGGGVASNLKQVNLNIDNQLDTTSFVIAGGGLRYQLPEGIANVSGNIVAIFENNIIALKASNETKSEMTLTLTIDADEKCVFDMQELRYSEKTPAIDGPAGIELNLDFEAYYENETNASAVQITLTNLHPSYAN